MIQLNGLTINSFNMIKVMFFSYPLDSNEAVESTRVFSSLSSFKASLSRRRSNLRFTCVCYNVLATSLNYIPFL